MSNLDNIISAARLIYHTSNLPVWIFQKKKCIFKIPENITSAELILNNKFTVPKILEVEETTQTIESDYKELAIVLNTSLKHLVIAVGPFLDKQIESGTLSNMVRDGTIPFHQKSIIQNYYQSLKVLSEVQIHYTSKLLETMFSKSSKDEEKTVSLIHDVSINESYISTKNEYRKNVFLHSPYATEQEIMQKITSGDSEGAKSILKEINLTPHAKLATGLLRSYKNSMICSCTLMTRAAIKGGLNPDEAFTISDTYINKIENSLSTDELRAIEINMAEVFADKVKNIKALNYSPTILSTINYIDDHLCEDITLEELGKQAFLNQSYLSNLFHKETGSTISEWINKKRIEEAAHFILNSKEDIADIAFFYHFSSQSYFVQCFKKVIGVTPGEYRKNGTKKDTK